MLPARTEIAGRLARAGCTAPFQEADELLTVASSYEQLEDMLQRRAAGEPLAWVTGWAHFAGVDVRVMPGVYVPRPQSELLVRRAVALLPSRGTAADLCCGSGAVAKALKKARPLAYVVASDLDAKACSCALANGIDARQGDLTAPLRQPSLGKFDVVTAVVPYVPTDQLEYLPRDSRENEPLLALNGGYGGTAILERAIWECTEVLRPGGTLLLEAGGTQDTLLSTHFGAAGYDLPTLHYDDDGDLRLIEARFPGTSPGGHPR